MILSLPLFCIIIWIFVFGFGRRIDFFFCFVVTTSMLYYYFFDLCFFDVYSTKTKISSPKSDQAMIIFWAATTLS